MRVLLVDDEEELVSTLAERLSFRGFEADWTTTGEGALALVKKVKYDLAVLDVKIPKVSGFDLKKKMEAVCPQLRFIFVTGHGSEEDFKRGMEEAGGVFYLIKPVNIDVLVKKMDEVFEEKESAQ